MMWINDTIHRWRTYPLAHLPAAEIINEFEASLPAVRAGHSPAGWLQDDLKMALIASRTRAVQLGAYS